MGRLGLGLIILIGLLTSGCSVLTAVTTAGPAPTPVVAGRTLTPTEPPATAGGVSASPGGAVASELATASAPTSYYAVAKSAEGGHGGPPLVDLPASIAVDYAVHGRCMFSIGLATATSAKGLPLLSMTVTGPEVTGTWRLSIKPGRYYVVTGEAVGCVYDVNVRDGP